MYKGWDYSDPVNDPIRKLNSTLDQKPGGPRKCYYHMAHVPGMPVLPVGVHPVDYDDLCNLSVARANVLMECFDRYVHSDLNKKSDIREKIYSLATFIGVKMKREWREEYDEWEEERDREMDREEEMNSHFVTDGWDKIDPANDPIRQLNSTLDQKSGNPRYYPLHPVQGMPVLPAGVYPLDYDDLCNLSVDRANLIMECFDLNDRNEVDETTDIREKIYIIATFIGVKMKSEWLDEWEEKDRVKEMERKMEMMDVKGS